MATTDVPLFQAREDRERLSVARWLSSPFDVRDLVREAGFPAGMPIWIGLCLSRSKLFADESMSGDVDVLIGGLSWMRTPEEHRGAIDRVRRTLRSEAHFEYLAWLADHEAVAAGKLQWSDPLERVAAIEAKASWFDRDRGVWKSTHVDSGRKISGQLRVLRDAGVDTVSLFHITNVAPQASLDHAWFHAAGGIAEAEDRLSRSCRTMPRRESAI